MEKFRYLTSADHAKWYVGNLEQGIEIPNNTLDIRPGLRTEMRTWIEEQCQGSVWAWNKTQTPLTGQSNWGKMVAPQGDMVMFFEHADDQVLFQLTWC